MSLVGCSRFLGAFQIQKVRHFSVGAEAREVGAGQDEEEEEKDDKAEVDEREDEGVKGLS